MKRYVIDIDNTISTWDDNRDYINFKPIQPVIDKINELFLNGNYIILHTARGMKSMNGDILKIELILRPTLETWLKNNNVHYHELIMGKPNGDYYIDDKGISIENFLK